MTTGVKQSELDRIAALADSAMASAGCAANDAGAFLMVNDRACVELARVNAMQARSHCEQIVRRLLALGASRPGPAVAVDSLPLELLDTPANRRFLDALEVAAEAGAEVDRERGWIDSDGQPTGHGETLAGLALLARREVFGPQGLD